jgi:hypothetical protein
MGRGRRGRCRRGRRVEREDVLEEDPRAVGEAALGGDGLGGGDGLVPAGDRLGLAAHREPLDLVEVGPEVVALDAVDAELDRQADDVGELGDVALEEGELEGDAAAVAAAAAWASRTAMKVADVGEDPLPARAEHDRLVGRRSRRSTRSSRPR